MNNVLVLGGTRFFGKELVKELITKGDNVTILTRGILKDDFGDKVERIIADRCDEKSLQKALQNKTFDIVYDNICYSPNDAKISCNVFKDKTKRYIVTSSSAVYDLNKGLSLKEDSFNAKEYNITFGERKKFSYSEGKRLMESVFSKYAEFDVAMVRFPVVIGKDDYTGRLNTYIDKIINKEKICTTKKDGVINFITQNEAGVFLAWLSEKELNGPINAACVGELSLEEILNIIEEESGMEALIDTKLDAEETSPYNNYLDLTISTIYVRGFFLYRFKDVKSELRLIVKEELEKRGR